MIKSRSVRVLCLVFALLLSISIIGFSGGGVVEGGRGGPGYQITWAPPRVSAAVSPGGSWEGSVSFTSSIDLVGAELSVVPELAPFVSIDPQSFPAVVAGTLNTVHVRIAVPDDAELDVAYEGTIRVRVGRRIYPQPLRVNIYVAPPLETNTEESYTQTIEMEARAVELFYDSESGLGTEEARRITLEFVREQDEVFDAGISEGGSIWVVHKSGIHALISTSPQGTLGADYEAWDSQVSGEALVSTSTSPIPGNTAAILLCPVYTEFEDLGVPRAMGDVKASLEGIGYDVTFVSDGGVTVNLLKTMHTHGVVNFVTHGDVWSDRVVLMTGEEATFGSMREHRSDLLGHRLARNASRYGNHWLIAPSFVTHYADKPYPNSIVVANACLSRANLTMADAFLAAGAYVYCGWTEKVLARTATASNVRLFQRLAQGVTLEEAYLTLMGEGLHYCPLYKAWFICSPTPSRNIRLFDPGDEVVHFPDPNLEARIRKAIDKPTGPIYRSDLVGLTLLSAGGSSIADLTGLEYCTDLVELRLANNQISDVSPLAGHTSLRSLSLGNNPISDISPLAGLTGLRYLALYSTLARDLSPLKNLTNLGALSLGSCDLTDISALASLTGLYWLDLDWNGISDISPLANLTNLAELYLGNNRISNIWPLAGLTNIHLLDLSYNQISDIKPLVENPGLDYRDVVDLCGNRLSDDSYNIYIPELVARGVIVYYEYF